MKVSRIHILLLSSILFLCISCGVKPYAFLKRSSATTACLNSLKPQFKTVLYNTSVNVVGNHLSGLLLMKRMPDGSTRVVFSNEMGLTLFDFEFFENEFRVLSCIKKLNRTVVLRALRKDIGMILQTGFNYSKVQCFKSDTAKYYAFPDGNETTYLITDSVCNSLTRIENSSKRKRKIIVNLSGYGEGLADSIYIAHQAFQFNIALKKIERKDAPQ